jgi:glycerate-2-kinase
VVNTCKHLDRVKGGGIARMASANTPKPGDALFERVQNDAFHFFAPLGDLVITGPTGTNVNDLLFILVA